MESASVKCNSEEASLRSDSFITFIKAELALTPKDLHLHETLLKRYLSINEVDKAFDHAYNVEFRDKIFKNNVRWYKILNEILDSDKNEGWIYQVLLLTVRERICSLNLSETSKSNSGLSTEETLYAYDQAIYKVISLGPSLGFEIFHTAMLEHHKGQIALHSATFWFIKNRHIAMIDTTINSLMLIAWQQVPSNLRRNWLRHSPEKHVLALNRWYIEGTYRCSQAGHYCLHLNKKFSLQSFWLYNFVKSRYDLYLYEKTAITSTVTTYFGSGAIGPHSHILPKQFEVEAYDKDAQKEYPRSLHHMVWTLLKYEKMADFECTLFDKLNFSSMDSEHALNKLDIYAFLYCVTLTARNNGKDISTLPANIESILCSDVQAKWWERAYEYYTNEVGSDLIGIDATFAYGITVVRCMGNNKLDPELLYNLGCIFSERAEKSTDIKETHQLKERASLYYQTALLFLQKLINTSVENDTQYRDITMFNYVRKDMDDIKLKHLFKECKIGIIKNSLIYGEYQTLYNLAQTYKKNALIFNDLKTKDKVTRSLLEAKTFASKAFKLLEQETNINYIFYWEVQELIQEIEMAFKSFGINSTDRINSKYSEHKTIPATYNNLFTIANSSWFEEYCKLMKKNIASYRNLLESATNQVNDKINKYKKVTEDFQCLKRQITKLEVRINKNSSLGQTYIGRNPLPLPGLSTTSTVSSISVGTPRATPATSENSFSVNLTNNENFSVTKPSIFLDNENENTGMFALRKSTYFSDLVSNKNYALPVSVPGAQLMFEPTRSQVNNCGVYPTPNQIYLDGAYLVPPNVRAVSTIPPVVTPMLPTVPSMAASSIPVTSVKPIDTKDTARSLPVNVVITSSDPLPTCTTTPVPALSVTIPPKHIKGTPHNNQIATPSTNETNVFVSPPVFVFPQFKTMTSTGTFANWNNSSVFKTTPINTASTVRSILQDALISLPKISADTLDTSSYYSNQVVMTLSNQVVTTSSNQVVTMIDQLKKGTPKFGLDQAVQSVTTSNGKSVFGGFIFSSTPTLKHVLDDEESVVKKPLEVVTNKMNVFSGISLKSNTSFPSTNIFNITPTNISTPNNITQNMAQNTSVLDKLNSSDTVEEYEPNVDFKPVIPLPALVDQKTGEEDETVLFEHRAKLLRFDAASKEWKERGLGNIKLLVHKDNIQKVRLLMRREQIMKVCCNHAITKDMIFQKMPNVDKAVIWCAKDFSESELVAETLCLRFKTALLCDQFMEAVKASQAKIKDESKSAKEEQNAAKQTAQTGFGDNFKPKSGSWHCDACYTNNLETFNKCACCETPKPRSTTGVKTIISAPTNVTITVGWGDKFKPKAGSWECQSCLVCNDATLESCTTCNSPKDSTAVKTLTKPLKQLHETTKLNSGIPPSTATSTVAVKVEDIADITERDLFEPNPVEHNTVDEAVHDGSFDTVNLKLTILKKDDSDDIIFVKEIQATQEEKQKASELMLPENFFTYKNKEPCQGCRGCQNDDSKSTSSESESSKTLTTTLTTESHTISETKSASTTGTSSLLDTSTPETNFNVALRSEMSQQASSANSPDENNPKKTETTSFSVETSPSFTALSSASDSGFDQSKKIPDFKWAGGAGEPILITKKQSAPDSDKLHSDSATHVEEVTGGDEEYAPIVALPDRVVVTTEE